MCDARIRCRSGRFSIDATTTTTTSTRQRPTRRAACDARATRVDATRSPRRFDARRRARRRDATTTTTTTREFVGDSDDARFFEDVGARDGVGVGVGRVDVVGGIADYSGATVAQLALRGRRTECRARFGDAASGTSGTFRARTVTIGAGGAEEVAARCFEARFDEVFDAETFEAGKTREYFEGTASAANERWAAYVAGAAGEFLRAIASDADASMRRARAWVKNLARCDCEIEIRSDVPQGKGVASSAAVEIAVARAVAHSVLRAGVVSEDDAAARFSAHVAMIPLYCQAAENDVVGAPCGFMDQYACFHSVDSASRGNFIAIDCDLANTLRDGAEDIYRLVPLPRKLRVWGIDSGVRHSNSGGSDYARVRCGTFMGKKILINEMNARLNRDVVPSEVESVWCHHSSAVGRGQRWKSDVVVAARRRGNDGQIVPRAIHQPRRRAEHHHRRRLNVYLACNRESRCTRARTRARIFEYFRRLAERRRLRRRRRSTTWPTTRGSHVRQPQLLQLRRLRFNRY